MDAVFDWVKSGLIFGVVGSVLIALSPNKSYEKYISFVVGLLFILVMIHPVMVLFSADSEVFLRSVENYIMFESCRDRLSSNDKALYEDALGMQLKAVFTDAGCELDRVEVFMDDGGTVYEVRLVVAGDMLKLSQIETYLHRIFGEEVVISYENQ